MYESNECYAAGYTQQTFHGHGGESSSRGGYETEFHNNTEDVPTYSHHTTPVEVAGNMAETVNSMQFADSDMYGPDVALDNDENEIVMKKMYWADQMMMMMKMMLTLPLIFRMPPFHLHLKSLSMTTFTWVVILTLVTAMPFPVTESGMLKIQSWTKGWFSLIRSNSYML
ncbi:hypothetical protein CsSME_00011527 [Camellia sinensis var. sinensis]